VADAITKGKGERLSRYTSLPVVLDILTQKRITLLSPKTWEDHNDAYYLERYRREMKLGSVLAICFSMKGETFHHWRVFSHGSAGVRVEFDKAQILTAINGKRGLRYGTVKYRLIQHVEKRRPPLEDWPFLKRMAFRAESEFRIIYETEDRLPYKNVSIELDAICTIVLSPWLPDSVSDSVIQCIRGIHGCRNLKVERSSLLDNDRWRRAVESSTGSTTTARS
jgi:hypothetical protein